MESRYKEILLLVGLDNITDEELQRFKFFLPDEFTIAKGKLEAANRTMLANLMIQNQGVKFAVTKTIALFRKLNYMHVATSLEEEKEKVDNAFMINEREKDPKIVKKKSEAEMCSMAPAPSRNDVSKLGATPEASPPTQPEKKALVVQQGSLRECLKKESLTVLVLKAMKPFKFQTQEGEQEMFHATVATETDFFFVKVFNTQLKDKFVSRRIIVISQYYQHRDYLEVNSSSIVSDANSDQKVSVPQSIIRKAGETPKISKLQTQPPGTVVNGVFVIQKKTERKDSVLFDLNDNTGRMKALVLGNQSKVPCAKGDKLRLTFFEVSKSGEKLQLTSGVHSLIKVIKAKK